MTETERDLLSELATMKQLVQALEARLDAVRGVEAPTMRARLRCPACGVARIAHARKILDRGDYNGAHPMAIAQTGGFFSTHAVGELEAYTCTGCGLVEWYVKEPAKLKPIDVDSP